VISNPTEKDTKRGLLQPTLVPPLLAPHRGFSAQGVKKASRPGRAVASRLGDLLALDFPDGLLNPRGPRFRRLDLDDGAPGGEDAALTVSGGSAFSRFDSSTSAWIANLII
jgi:hypothetical protein